MGEVDTKGVYTSHQGTMLCS